MARGGPVEVKQVAFVCGCGYGQRGDRGILGPAGQTLPEPPEVTQAWDGHTVVTQVGDTPPECPNVANHRIWRDPGLAAHAPNVAEMERLKAQYDALAAQLREKGVI